MNEAHHTELAALLERRRTELADAATRLRDAMSNPADNGWPEVRDSVDDGDARMMATLDMTSLQRQDHELREILEAQRRMRQGQYGRCEECDEPIPFERLKLRPEARFCVQHEEAWEQAHPAGAPVQS